MDFILTAIKVYLQSEVYHPHEAAPLQLFWLHRYYPQEYADFQLPPAILKPKTCLENTSFKNFAINVNLS